jgi:hypothetical protein
MWDVFFKATGPDLYFCIKRIDVEDGGYRFGVFRVKELMQDVLVFNSLKPIKVFKCLE